MIWAKVLSKNLGISIVFSGQQPVTNGKTIRVFALPDMIDEATENALIGAIDHECGHVDPKNGSMIGTSRFDKRHSELEKKYGPLGHHAWNVLEDMRIETNLHDRFAGCMKYFEAIREWLWFNAEEFEEMRSKPMDKTAFSALVGLAYVRFPRLFKEIILPRSSTELLMLVRYWTPFVGRSCNASDVWEVFDLAEELLEELKQMAKGGGGSGDEDGIGVSMPGDGEGDAQGSGPPGSAQGDQSEDSPGDPLGGAGGGQPGQDLTGDLGDGGAGGSADGSQGAAGGGEQGQAAGGAQQDQAEGGGLKGGVGAPETSDQPVDGQAAFDWDEVYESHPDFKDTHPDSAPMSNSEVRRHLQEESKRVIDNSTDPEFHVPDFGVSAMESIDEDIDQNDRAGYRIDDQAVRVKHATATQNLSSQIANEAKGLYPVIRQKLRTLLLAKRANRHRSDCYDGELDPGSLYALAIPNGPRNVFTQMTRGRAVNTCALLLIDGSSSMSGKKSQTVMRCAYFFSDCLERCNVPTEVAVFQNSSSSGYNADYQIIKSFEERMSKASSRFTPMASGGTPMAEAMVEAVRRLGVRLEQRKLLFILTDGQPNGTYGDSAGFMVRLADFAKNAYRVETVGLGVQTKQGVANCFRDFVMLDKSSRREVERDFINVMQNRILDQ